MPNFQLMIPAPSPLLPLLSARVFSPRWSFQPFSKLKKAGGGLQSTKGPCVTNNSNHTRYCYVIIGCLTLWPGARYRNSVSSLPSIGSFGRHRSISSPQGTTSIRYRCPAQQVAAQVYRLASIWDRFHLSLLFHLLFINSAPSTPSNPPPPPSISTSEPVPPTVTMAPITLFDISISEAVRANASLKAILEAAKEHASSPEVANTYPALRLIPDMLGLDFQIKMVTNTSKRIIERLVPSKAASLPNWDAEELKTLDDLIARVARAQALLEDIKPEDVEGVDEKTVECGLGPKETAMMEAKGYILGYVLPNLVFHSSVAYSILRKEGVPLGKKVFLNAYLEPVVKELVKKE